jgi:ferredoxin
MKAVVDQDTCIGCELCPSICPEVFAMVGATAEAIADPVPAEAEARCRQAADDCPVDAISVSE